MVVGTTATWVCLVARTGLTDAYKDQQPSSKCLTTFFGAAAVVGFGAVTGRVDLVTVVGRVGLSAGADVFVGALTLWVGFVACADLAGCGALVAIWSINHNQSR